MDCSFVSGFFIGQRSLVSEWS